MAKIIQKRLAAQILKCSPKRIKLDSLRMEDIKKAITKVDVRSLIKEKAIKRKAVTSISKSRIRKNKEQKRKGRQRGYGSRKGTKNLRMGKKRRWINLVRAQRELIKELKLRNRISTKSYRMLYLKIKSGFFRNKRHVKLYIGEQNLLEKKISTNE
ncbi:MAG: 50S ribosomal protein L19e [Candidatus Woesearchaeota archaeon]|jgi:large subunit ribosomal protein L19e|nr:50S ribosomal protein L19e [Candidatus Woesearchaeota archaeon]MDP7505982.1 50S ribosomal protein L19e [Candidatus Woesearchaeota archaeon]MDP7610445.1 50S ribosomal protein L19e [Candidatus Woesearchaeota archaeon]